MNLWIRSQDRTTLIRSYEIYVSEQCNRYLIRAKRTSHILGSYSTIERAVEILDEIQNSMKNFAFAKKVNGLGEELDLIPNPILIYQMPKE